MRVLPQPSSRRSLHKKDTPEEFTYLGKSLGLEWKSYKHGMVCVYETKGGVMRISDENLRGRTVIAADGQAIGEVATLNVESDTWQVESLQIKLRNEIADQLGVSRNIFHAGTLEVPIRSVQSVGDAIVLSVPTLQLRQVPEGSSSSAAAH